MGSRGASWQETAPITLCDALELMVRIGQPREERLAVAGA